MQVLDKGSLTLKAFLASDLGVVASARVSNGASFEAASKGEEADSKLINYLVKHKHGTPFEHNLFTFYVDCPFFVRSEWERHRIGWSYNEVSRRYVSSQPKFYVPDKWRVRGSSTKQGSIEPSEEWLREWHQKWMQHEGMPEVQFDSNHFKEWEDDNLTSLYEYALRRYNDLLDEGIAPELARLVLPQGTYTQFYASCNARSLMHFLNLRNHENAQWEIRQYCIVMEETFKEKMPITYQAFVNNGRQAP